MTASGCRCCSSCRRSGSVMRSTLLKTRMVFFSPAPISVRTSVVVLMNFSALGRAGIHDVDEEVRQRGLLQRGAEALHEIVRQLADEADRVGQQHLLAVGQFHAARAGVERGEELVLRQHVALA